MGRSCEIGQRPKGKQRVILNGGHPPFRRVLEHFDDRRGLFLFRMAACYLERSVGHKYLFTPVFCIQLLAETAYLKSVTAPQARVK